MYFVLGNLQPFRQSPLNICVYRYFRRGKMQKPTAGTQNMAIRCISEEGNTRISFMGLVLQDSQPFGRKSRAKAEPPSSSSTLAVLYALPTWKLRAWFDWKSPKQSNGTIQSIPDSINMKIPKFNQEHSKFSKNPNSKIKQQFHRVIGVQSDV